MTFNPGTGVPFVRTTLIVRVWVDPGGNDERIVKLLRTQHDIAVDSGQQCAPGQNCENDESGSAFSGISVCAS